MGKFTNLILIAAAVALVIVGVAAQTGTLSWASHGRHSGAVGGQTARQPQALATPAYIDNSPATDTAQPAANQQPVTTEDSGSGHGHGHGHGGGGDNEGD